MNCQDIARVLDERDAGGPMASEQRDVRAHLATCADCARDWQIHTELADEVVPAVPAELRAQFAAPVAGGARQNARRGRLLVVGALLAAAAAAGMLAMRTSPPAPIASVKASAQEEPSVVQVYGGTVAALEEPALDADSEALADWTQRVAEWLAVREDPDALLTAALLLRSKHPPQRADLIRRAAALAPDSARIQATAMVLCFAPCDSRPYEQALQRLTPGNALGWAGEANRAFQAGDQKALRRALTAMSHARTFDTYEGATMVAMTSQMRSALVPPPDIKGFVPAMGAILAFTAMPIPAYRPITNTCESTQDEAALIECRRIGAAMRAGDTTLTNALGLTVSGHGLPADSAEARALEQEAIQFSWISMRSQITSERQDDPDGYLNTFADHPRAMDALRAYLEARGIPTEPPEGWTPK